MTLEAIPVIARIILIGWIVVFEIAAAKPLGDPPRMWEQE